MISKFFFIVWFLVLSVPFTMMMGQHVFSLRASESGNLDELVNEKKWTLLHFVNPDCGCSQNVVNALVKRSAKKDAHEKVYVLGQNDTWIRELKASGYEVHQGDMDNFSEKYQISAVPQLVIFNSEKERLYAGGYSHTKGPKAPVEDQKILADLQNKENVKELPIFGCVSGTDNRNKADIFGFKYKR